MQPKMKYGIHLNHDYACIARMEDGEPEVIRSEFNLEAIPLCVGFNKKGRVLVGNNAKQSYTQEKVKSNFIKSEHSNFFDEFTRTLGTSQTYYAPNVDQSFSAEEILAEVFKHLRSLVTDEQLKSVVVTVPAKFDIGQKDAILEAAEMAGIEQCELLQEPIAALIAYGLNITSENNFNVVFNLSRGTFQADLVKVDEAGMKVVDSEEDHHLGDVNVDMAIVDEILLPYLQEEYSIESIIKDEEKRSILQNALKAYAEEAKKQLSNQKSYNILSETGDIPGKDDEGEAFELDIILTREELKKIIGPIFQRAIDLTQNLVQRNNLEGHQLNTLILVGEATHSPILREMLENQVAQPVTSLNSLTAIAKGAAFYASTIDVSEAIQEASRVKTKLQLDICYEAASVETEEMVAIKMLTDKTEGEIPTKVFAEISRGDKAWSSGKVEITEKGEVIEVQLTEGKHNAFELFLYDEAGNKLEGQPDHFTIIQGISSTDSATTMPHQIGIEMDKGGEYPVFEPIKGLEKNVPLPATGTIHIKTDKDIRPGMSEDKIRIGLYQGEYDSKDSRAIYNKHIYDAVITGDDLPALLPKNSDVNLEISTDLSGRIQKLEAYFPYLETSTEIPIPEQAGKSITEDFLNNEMERAKKVISRLKNNELINQEEVKSLEKELEYQEKHFEQWKSDVDRRQEVFDNLQNWFRKADRLENSNGKAAQYQTTQSKPKILKNKLIELYADHPEISENQFRHLFDRLFELSEKTSLSEEEEEELEAIETEIKGLI